MEFKVKKYNGISPSTFYAITYDESRDSGYINVPLWIVNTETGELTEVHKGTAYFNPDCSGKVEFLIFANSLVFSVDTYQDVFKDKFKNVTTEGYEKGLYDILKGWHILFLNQREAALKAQKILLEKQSKINEEVKMVKSLISY